MTTKPDPLRDLYKSLSGKGALPLAPDDPYYVPILPEAPEKDPILALWRRLDWSESESVDLLTGYRGNGKSTELRRLRRLLEENSGAKVFLVDMLDFLLMTKPLEPSDFVLSLMAALGEAVEKETGLHALTHGYWERLHRFLTTEVKLENLELDLAQIGAPVKLGLKLKNEPDFKERVQHHLRGHLSRLIEDAQAYVVSLVRAIREEAEDPDLKVVLLVDSVEQIRGVGTEATQVHDSVVELFSGQAASLAFPQLHLVYTIPPFLRVSCPRTRAAPWAATPSPSGPMSMCGTGTAPPTPPASRSWRPSSTNAGRTGATSSRRTPCAGWRPAPAATCGTSSG